jgi:hypothetical protein
MTIVRTLLMGIVIATSLPSFSHDSHTMTTNEKAIKAAKILGYVTELAIAGHIYGACIIASDSDMNPAKIWESLLKKEFSAASLKTELHVPFLATIVHATYGLYHELKSLGILRQKKRPFINTSSGTQ